MTSDPITLVVAVAAALIVSFLVADVIGRAVQSMLRAIIEDPETEARLVDGPQRVVRLGIFAVTSVALVVPALRFAGLETEIGGSPEALGRWALDAGLRIALIAVAAYLAIRIGTASARRFEREMSRGTGLDVIERTKRAKTLGGLIQKTLSIVTMGIAGLMILRELHVDITPVLTGAGIVGLAVGFGAQTLVRDVISGFFLIMEDQVRVGDVAAINGQGGLVEAVNLRTIVLRDETGTVHVFPNGEVKTLANMSKDFSYFVFSVPFSYEEDPDQIIAAMLDAGRTMLEDENFKPHILEPVEVYGVDALDPGQFNIKGRIKTVPQKQWTVGRELRKRFTATFKARNLQMPRPTMQVTMEPAPRKTPPGPSTGQN